MEQNLKKMNNPDAMPSVASGEGVPLQQPPLKQDGQNPYASLDNGLKKFFGEEFELADSFSQNMLLQHLRINREQNERLADAMENDPRLAQMLSDMIEGKRNAHSAMARYFGRSVMQIDEDSPEYEEIMLADEERRNEVARLANDRKEYEANLAESIPVIEKFCEEKGYDPSDFMGDVWEKLVFPVLAGHYSYDVCELLDHAVCYEQDVEDAFAAGDIKGRNTSIMRMKEDLGDGLPKGLNSVAPAAEKKTKRNSLIEKALGA